MKKLSQSSRRLMIILLSLVFLLNIGDLVLTYKFLDIREEANPVAGYIWENWGFMYLTTIKMLISIMFTGLMLVYHRQKPLRAIIVASFMLGVYTLVNFLLIQVALIKFPVFT